MRLSGGIWYIPSIWEHKTAMCQRRSTPQVHRKPGLFSLNDSLGNSADTETFAKIDPTYILILDDIFGGAAHQYMAIMQDVGTVHDFQRFPNIVVCDQDTEGAIVAPGRCDLFMGIGPEARTLAGGQYAEGTMYYFFLKPTIVASYDD